MISLEPSRFRSPLLEELPPVPRGRDGRSLRRRRLFVILVLAGAIVPAVAVGMRRLSSRGPGFVLYWLHDEVYLPLKGHLFTWLFPVSWIYVLSALTLLSFGLVAVAWVRPLTPAWQTAVGRQALSWRWMRPVLRAWRRSYRGARSALRAGALSTERWPILGRRLASWAETLDGPTLLEELLEHERRAALDRLDGLDPSDAESVRALAVALDATLLSMEATATPRSDRAAVEAVERLDEVLLRLDLVRLARGEAEPSVEELRVRLEAEISSIVRPLLPVRPLRADFSVSALALELALVLELETPRSWPSELLEGRRERVLEGVEARRRAFDESRRRLESSAAFALSRGRRTTVRLPARGGRIEARLALDVALAAALRYGEVRSALAFLESLEGLRFAVLAAGDAGRVEEDRESDAEVLLSALAGLPRSVDYRVCSYLLGRETATAADLAEAVARGSELVSDVDLRLLSLRRADLSTAAADSQ